MTAKINSTPIMMQLKKEHQENLALCSNIRRGFIKGIPLNRIKNYVDWYWEIHLSPHFTYEERMVFPVLGNDNLLVKRAVTEHKRLRRFFHSKDEVYKALNRLEEELEAHIRFEERILFKEIAKRGIEKDIGTNDILRSDNKTAEASWPDEFWK